MLGSPTIIVLGTGLSLEPSVSMLWVNVPLVVQQPLPQPSLGDLVMEGFNMHPHFLLLLQALPPPVRTRQTPSLRRLFCIIHTTIMVGSGSWI